MANESSALRRIGVLALLAAGLWLVLPKLRRDATRPPPPSDAGASPDAARPDATAPDAGARAPGVEAIVPEGVGAAEGSPAPPPAYFLAVSPDESRALLRFGGESIAADPGLRFASVDLSSKAHVLWTEPALFRKMHVYSGDENDPEARRKMAEEIADPAILTDLARHADALRAVGLDSDGVVAIPPGPDTGLAAVTLGDFTFLTVLGGKGLVRIPSHAAYDPVFSDDGETLYFRCIHGMHDDVTANYDLCAVPSKKVGPPRFLAKGVLEILAFSPDRKTMFLSTEEDAPKKGHCLVRVDLAPKPKTTTLACATASVVTAMVSREARAAVLATFDDKTYEHAIEWVDLEKGGVVAHARVAVNVFALRDDGTVVLAHEKPEERCLELVAPTGRRASETGSFREIVSSGKFVKANRLYAIAFRVPILRIDLDAIPFGKEIALEAEPQTPCFFNSR